MIFRTDLAMELEEQHRSEQIPGIVSQDETVGNLTINKIQITSEEAAQKIGKPIGEYVTVTVPPFSDDVTSANEEIEAMAQHLECAPDHDPAKIAMLEFGEIDPEKNFNFDTRFVDGEIICTASASPDLQKIMDMIPARSDQ